MLKTADVLDARRLSAPMPTGTASEGLRRLVATTALATGVIVGMMLFQPGAAQAQAPLDLNGVNTTLPAAGSFNNQAFLNGSDNLLNTAAGAASLTSTGGNALYVGQIIESAGAITINQIGGNNTYGNAGNNFSGGFNLSAGGTVGVGANSALGTGLVTLDAGTTLRSDAVGLTLANAIALAGPGASTVDTQINTMTLGGVISGAGGLTKIGAGTLQLTGANAYTGGTTLSAGTLTLSGAGTLGANANALTVSGGTLDLGALNITQNGGLTLTGGTISNGTLTSSGTFGVQAGAVGATLAGAGGLTKTTAGTVTLTGANTYTGATTITAGVLNIQNNTALGNVASGATVAAGAALQLQGGITVGAKALSLSGTGVANDGALRSISGFNIYGGVITLGSPARINADAGQLNIDGGITGAGQDLTVGGGGTVNITGNVTTGAGGVTKDGAGNAQLGGTNTYTGVTTVNDGFLILINGASIADTGAVVINAPGQLNMFSSETVGSVTGDGSILLSGGSTLTTGDATSTVFSGVIKEQVGAGNLVKQGAGTFTLSGANTYTGTTTINAGVLNIQNATALGTTAGGTTVANGAALQIQGNIAVGAEALSLSGTGIANDGALRNISGTNSFGGAITLTSASRINSDAGTLTLTGGVTGAFALTVGGAGNTTISGAIATGAGTLTKDGTGMLVLSGANTYTGATTINGGELRVNGSLGNTAVAVNNTGTLSGIGTIGGAVTVNAGGTLSAGQSPGTLTVGSLTLNAGSNSVFELNTPGTVGGVTNDLIISNGPVQLGGTLTATAPSAGFYRLINVVGGGAITGTFATVNVAGFTGQVYTNAPGAAEQVNLAVIGAGQIMQFWDGADTLGNGTVDGGAGTWNAANTNWTGLPGQAGVNAPWLSSVGVFQGTAGVITVAGTQAFDTLQFNVDGYTLNGGQLGIGVAGGGTINVNGAGLTTTINSAIVDGVGTSLTKVGAGTLNLGGVNTYTGGTTVSAGTLGLLAGGVLASNVTVDAAGTFNNAGTVNASVINNGTTINSNLISGSVTNTGTLTTTGTIQSGVTNSGTVNAAGTINGAIANNAGTFTVSGALAGNGAFTNASGATLNVTGGSFTGLTSVSNAGTVNVGGGFTLSAPTILNSGSFASAGTINAATLFSNTGAVNASGAINTAELRNTGTFTLTGALGGAVTALNNNAGGTLSVGSASFSGIGTLTNSGLVQIGTGSLSAATIANLGTFNSAGAVTATTAFNNSGTANLSGTVTTPVLNNNGTLNVVGGDLTTNAALLNSGIVALTAGRSLSVGSFNNAGTLNLQNNVANNAVNIAGAYTGNGNVLLDVDIGGSRADRITVNGGGSSGTGVVAINQVLQSGGGIGISQNDILVVSGASGVKFTAANAVASSTPSPFAGGGGQLLSTSNSIVQYWFGETAPNSGTYVVRPDLNVTAASSFVASVSSALSSINAYSEPASAFISGPSDPGPNTLSFGSWGRARGGRLDTDSTSRVNSPGGVSRSFDMTNRTDFNGFQLGLDMGLYNINGTGWTTNIGLHGGKVEAQVRSTGVALDLTQPFYGAYAAVRNSSGFAFDVLFRRDQFDMKLTSQAANLSKEKLKADGYSGLASLSQRFNITDTIYIDPSVAILYSRAEVDRLRVGADSSVAWQPIESITGRVGVQVGTFFQPTSEIIVSPYVALSAWREFSGKTEAVGSFATVSFPTTTNRVGTYGQASLGAAVSSVTPGLSGFVRGDIRFGDRVEGFAFNGGLRYQF